MKYKKPNPPNSYFFKVLGFLLVSLIGTSILVSGGSVIIKSGGLNVSNSFYVDPSTGYVGIGTNNPGSKLDVSGTVLATAFTTANNAGAFYRMKGQNLDGSYTDIMNPGSGTFRIKVNNGAVDALHITSGGNVGIGTTNPITKLEIKNGNVRILNTNPTYYLTDSVGTQVGEISYDETNNIAYINAPEAGAKMRFGTQGSVDQMVLSGGNVGIGDTTPDAKLDVEGNIEVAQGSSIYFRPTEPGRESVGYFGIDDGLSFTTHGYGAGFRWYNYPASAANRRMLLDTAGNLQTDGSMTANAWDLAEYTPTKNDSGEPGDIMVIDADANEQIKLSTKKYEPLIAGVIATKPGLIMGSGGLQEPPKGKLLSLVGRVLTKISTENGPIIVGDLITSSDIPGVGMKATQPGSMAGIALEAFDGKNGTRCGEYICGKILVFVNVGEGNTAATVNIQQQEIERLKADNKLLKARIEILEEKIK